MNIQIKGGSLSGAICAPDSKSDIHRALIAMALADKPSRMRFSTFSDDINVTIRCLKALGAEIRKTDNGCEVIPLTCTKSATLDCDLSGSTLRFLLPVAAALGTTAAFEGRGRLPERPLGPLLDEMKRHGISVSSDRLPLTITGKMTAGLWELPGNVSSQFITGLLLALPFLREEAEIRLTTKLESSAYVDMTLSTLKRFGVVWKKTESAYHLEKGAAYHATEEYVAEGDWSGAAFYLTAGALGAPITISGLSEDSHQPDKAILGFLKAAGAAVSSEKNRITVSPAPLRPFEADVSACPDIFPILAVLAAGIKGDSLLYGGGRLRLKESDRIATTARMLTALGGNVTEGPDFLRIHGKGYLMGGTVDGAGDHRIVMAATTASIIAQNSVSIEGAEAYTKSYPGFFEDFSALGGSYAIL